MDNNTVKEYQLIALLNVFNLNMLISSEVPLRQQFITIFWISYITTCNRRIINKTNLIEQHLMSIDKAGSKPDLAISMSSALECHIKVA